MRLPWVINDAVFTAGCTQCKGCVDTCETNIIVQDSEGFPTIDFNLGECLWALSRKSDCKAPTYPLLPLDRHPTFVDNFIFLTFKGQ